MKPDCILIRVGEQALKSDQVLTIFEKLLIRNMKAALKDIDYKLVRERNRFFIFSKDNKKVVERLKMVFGITSLSPCYVTNANIEDIQELSKKIFKPKGTFAIRARRAGSHKFTSQDIAQKVGYIINAPANLSNPDSELFIECRQNKAYVFTEKILGIGGLPLGSAGKIFSYLENKQDLIAAWLLARRGCQITVLGSNKTLFKKLEKWHIGIKLEVESHMPKDFEETGIGMGEQTYQELKGVPDLLILRPLVGFKEDKINDILTQIGG
ncbi:MAG: hypothetical protein KJ906_04095 [Nanoarchaeota archaeon]|nr:hypothetical protein [Nanoarchaeota archaeon]